MNKLTHEEEKILKYGKITNTIAKDIGELIETRLEEEEITIAVVVAPHLKHEGPDIDKLNQNLRNGYFLHPKITKTEKNIKNVYHGVSPFIRFRNRKFNSK